VIEQQLKMDRSDCATSSNLARNDAGRLKSMSAGRRGRW